MLTVDTLRAHADFVLDGAECTIDAALVFDGAIVFVAWAEMPAFVDKLLPLLATTVRIVVVSQDPTRTELPESASPSGMPYDSNVVGALERAMADQRVKAVLASARLLPAAKLTVLPIGNPIIYHSTR